MAWSPKNFLLSLYILTHIIVCIVGIETWPLTDYPMYGASYAPYSEFSVYRWRAYTHDKKFVWLPKHLIPYYTSVNAEEARAIRVQDWPAIVRNLSQMTSYNTRQWKSYARLGLIERTAHRSADGKFEIRDVEIFSINISELIK